MKRSIYNISFFTAGIFLIFIVYLICQASFNEVLFPGIGEIAIKFGDFFHGKGILSVGYTILRLIASLAISFVISMLITFLYYIFKPTKNFFKPLLFLLKVTPIIAIVLYVQAITARNAESAPYIVTTMMMVPLMTEAYTSGIDNIDKGIIDSLRLENPNKIYQFFKIIIPMIGPNIILSLLQSIGMGLKVVVMVEYFCFVDYGIGGMLSSYYTAVEISGLIATILFVAIIAGILEFGVFLLKKKVFKIS
jgi:ABC-type nitrate/sulfonate/bicarbonate transport system permease component